MPTSWTTSRAFLGKVNGQLARFPVPAGTVHGDRSVKDAVAGGLAALVEEHRVAIEAFGEDTRESTLKRAAERIPPDAAQGGGLQRYLAEERGRLDRDLTLASRDLRRKVEAISAGTDASCS